MLCAILQLSCWINASIHEPHDVTNFNPTICQHRVPKIPEVFLPCWNKLHLVLYCWSALSQNVKLWFLNSGLYVNIFACFGYHFLSCEVYSRVIQFSNTKEHVTVIGKCGVVIPEELVSMALIFF